jgi:hypothetical protein
MGWRTQENYELANERDFKRRPWRERRVLARAGWTIAVFIVFVCMMAVGIKH